MSVATNKLSSYDDPNSIFNMVRYRDLDGVKKYVEAGGDINATDDTKQRNPLIIISIRRKGLAVFDYLIKHGADINAQTALGHTALWLLIMPRTSKAPMREISEKSILKLMENGADPFIKNIKGITILDEMGTRFAQKEKDIILKAYAKHQALVALKNIPVSAKRKGTSL